MLKGIAVVLSAAIVAAGSAQTAPLSPWPSALQPIPFCVTADYVIHAGGENTVYSPSITSPTPKAVSLNDPIKQELRGVLHAGPTMMWTQEQSGKAPWESVTVVSLDGKALDGHDVQFQKDATSKMSIQPTGWLDSPRSIEFFIGEGLGWTTLSLSSDPAARTWSRFVEGFTMEPSRIEGGDRVIHGKNAAGWNLQIRTDAAGARLKEILLKNTSLMNGYRRLTVTQWERVHGRYLPSKGQIATKYAADPAAKPDMETLTTIAISHFTVTPEVAKVPYLNGMLFRSMAYPTNENPNPIEKAFRLDNGKLVAAEDPGNEPKQTENGLPHVLIAGVGAIGVLGIGLLVIVLRRRK